jgi:hypothetical protein
MKNITFLTFSVFLCSFDLQAEYPYKTFNSSYVDKEETVKIIEERTPTKSQDGVGICYGFTATRLLETHRCRELKLDCSDPNEALSTLDVSSYAMMDKKSLQMFGYAYTVLYYIYNGQNSIAKESCIQFSTLLHKKFFSKSEQVGWEYLISNWKDYRDNKVKNKSNDCVSCVAQKIKKEMVGLKTSIEQIAKALESNSQEEFLEKAVIPTECLEEAKIAKIPPFSPKKYPEANLPNTDLKNVVTTLLNAGTPLEMAICHIPEEEDECKDGAGHSVALYGIKEICKKNDCKTVVKVINSFGESWQQSHNDGWIDLDTLVESSKRLRNKDENISWIERFK